MIKKNISKVSEEDKKYHFDVSRKSQRSRSPKILHQKGDYVNKVFNFILLGSYMQPHQHPGSEKTEKMYLIQGSFALIIFDNSGNIANIHILEEDKNEFISVPAFTWHTYIMLSDEVIIYEEMNGVYNPNTWKKMAPWAPNENSSEAISYLEELRTKLSEFF
ncbi:WbuC family cupin fold metalloprotein [Alphaproteobacteria bacterium]|nr:WbuC family cupin fold metalloprotein [Alphaproteobacteria bacterium]